jgi:hypothetical protein
MGPLFIHQVIYEHEEAWWNDINMEKLLLHLSELSGKARRNGEGNNEFSLEKNLFHISKGSLTCHKIL